MTAGLVGCMFVMGSDLSSHAAPITQVAQVTSSRPTLKLGSTGNTVEDVQAILTLLGYYDSGVDGQYQTSTEAAVATFQQDAGLAVDGVLGPATWEKLLPTPSTQFSPPAVIATTAGENRADAENDGQSNAVELPILRAGMRGAAITQIQETLATLGFYGGALDGVFGPGTEAAVMAFQRSVNLADDGIVGPATWRALLR